MPGAAALPSLAQTIEHLPEVDPPLSNTAGLLDKEASLDLHYAGSHIKKSSATVSGQWLQINGVPVHLKSMRMESEQEYMRAAYWSPHRSSTEYFSIPGIVTHKLSAVLIADEFALLDELRELFLLGSHVDLVASFAGCGELHGEGRLLSYGLTFGVDVELAVDFWLPQVKWVEYTK